MKEVLALADRASRSNATVLLTGETGTGKEVLARTIHAGGGRAAGPFVAMNCAALPEGLVESELFGHVKGSFTGAVRAKLGLFEAADGGTLFLDEVGETSALFQVKLLRALQEREIRPVGETWGRRVDVRVIAATNRDLMVELNAGRFREDLYYRLAVFPIPVPPLRKRCEDILPLAEHFLTVHGEREGRPACRFAPETADRLLAHRWPGNVRELENEVLRALALSDPGDEIPLSRISERVGQWMPSTESLVRDGEPLHESLARVEAHLLRRALDASGGCRAEAARALGLTREGLYKKLKLFSIG